MKAAVAIFAFLALSAPASAGCGIVLNWSGDTMERCFREMQGEIDLLKLQVQTLEGENQIAVGNMCLLAMDVQHRVPGADVALVVEQACAELRARGSKKGKKPKKP